MKPAVLVALGLLTTLPLGGSAAHAPAARAAERFEVTSIKAVRPTLVKTIAALEKQDAAGARAAFDAYDSAWNGIEAYVSTTAG